MLSNPSTVEPDFYHGVIEISWIDEEIRTQREFALLVIAVLAGAIAGEFMAVFVDGVLK